MVKTKKMDSSEEVILKAAQEVFLEKGYQGARMQEIANRAGINKALLHYYFRSKERLYAHIFENVMSGFIGEWTEMFGKRMSVKETLAVFVDKFINVLKSNPNIGMFMAYELSMGGQTVSKVITNFMKDESNWGPWHLIDIINRGIQNGEIRSDVDARQLLLTLLGSCTYYFIAEPIIMSVFSGPLQIEKEQFLEERKQSILDTVLYGVLKDGE